MTETIKQASTPAAALEPTEAVEDVFVFAPPCQALLGTAVPPHATCWC